MSKYHHLSIHWFFFINFTSFLRYCIFDLDFDFMTLTLCQLDQIFNIFHTCKFHQDPIIHSWFIGLNTYALQADRRTDQSTNQPTDITFPRVAWTQLKFGSTKTLVYMIFLFTDRYTSLNPLHDPFFGTPSDVIKRCHLFFPYFRIFFIAN